MSKFGWRRGNPSTFIPVGDVGEAAKWLPYARMRLEAMMNSLVAAPTDLQPYRRRTYCPADGVIITLESLHGIPRITIETGLLVFTAGFENDEFVIKAATEYDRIFQVKLKPSPEPLAPPWSISSVGGFLNLGGGQGMFVVGRTSGVSFGYIVTIAGGVSIKPIVGLTAVNFEQPRIAYLGKFVEGKRLVNVYYVSNDIEQPRLAVFTVSSEIVADYQFPLPPGYTYGSTPVTVFYPIAPMGAGRAVMLARIGTAPVITYRRLYSTDGGISWEYLPQGPLELLLEAATPVFDAVPTTFKLAPLPGGRAIITGLANPTFPTPGSSAVVAFLSDDRGLTFTGPHVVRAFGVDQLLLEPIALSMTQVGILTVTDVGDVCLSRSDDGGVSWIELPPIAPGVATLLSNVRTVGNIVLLTPTALGVSVYSYADQTHHLYVSHDMGETWVKGQELGAATTSRDFYVALRIGSQSTSLPANPAIPELYDLV